MKSFYRTKDLTEAAFLYASGKKLLQLDGDNRKYWFVFEDNASCQDLASAFWRKEAMINAKTFADSIRSLKDLVFNKDER